MNDSNDTVKLWRLRPPVITLLAVLVAVTLLVLNERGYRSAVHGIQRIEAYEDEREQQLRLLRHLFDAEGAQRAHALTRDPHYIQVGRDALQAIADELQQLGAAPEHAERRARLDEGAAAVQQRVAALDTLLRDHSQPEGDAAELARRTQEALAVAELGRNLRQLLGELSVQSMQALKAGLRQYLDSSQRSRWALGLAVLFSFVAFQMYLRQTVRRMAEAAQKRKELEQRSRELQSKVRERTRRLAMLATQLQNVQEEERERLARELHDEMGALMTAAKLDVARLKSRLDKNNPELMQRLEHLTATLNEGISLKRRIIEYLRPSSLANLGLVSALEIQAAEFAERSGVQMSTHFDPVTLPNDRALAVYRIVQESLTNIAKYAQARRVEITLRDTGNAVKISIADDGVGFDVSERANASHGLPNMQHRADTLGGELYIQSAPGQGTRILARLPKG